MYLRNNPEEAAIQRGREHRRRDKREDSGLLRLNSKTGVKTPRLKIQDRRRDEKSILTDAERAHPQLTLQDRIGLRRFLFRSRGMIPNIYIFHRYRIVLGG